MERKKRLTRHESKGDRTPVFEVVETETDVSRIQYPDLMETIERDGIMFRVWGLPVPQPRGRTVFGKDRTGKTRVRVVSRTRQAQEIWFNRVRNAAGAVMRGAVRDAEGHQPGAIKEIRAGGPVTAELVFYLPTNDASRWHRAHEARPDGDNLGKLVLDALQRSGLLSDDSRVVRTVIDKRWCEPHRAGCVIVLRPGDPGELLGDVGTA